jgi:hypothetical protein
VAIDKDDRKVFCLIESIEDFDGHHRGFVAEYDIEGNYLQCSRLNTRFEHANKGFEGLAHIRRGNQERLYALCEGNLGTSAKRGGGRIGLRGYLRILWLQFPTVQRAISRTVAVKRISQFIYSDYQGRSSLHQFF